MITQEQLKETMERRDALKRYLDVDNKKIQIEEEELRTHVPDFWEHPKEAQVQMKKIKDLHPIFFIAASAVVGIVFAF